MAFPPPGSNIAQRGHAVTDRFIGYQRCFWLRFIAVFTPVCGQSGNSAHCAQRGVRATHTALYLQEVAASGDRADRRLANGEQVLVSLLSGARVARLVR